MVADDALSTAQPTALDGSSRPSVDDLPVRPGEDPWTHADVLAIEEQLTREVERLASDVSNADVELSDLLRNSGDGAGDDQADSGSSALEREQELTLVNNTRNLLAQATHALARVSAGTFATCESCGDPIGKARVLAFPRATLCVTCKQREERR